MNQPDYLDSPKNFPPAGASAYGQDKQGYWLEFNLFGVAVCFRWIPKGQFSMGSPKDEKGRYDFEDQHNVIISAGFWLADCTVSQALWLAVMDNNPSDLQTSNSSQFPVESVSWDDVQTFLQKVNQPYADLKLSLPWEAQWEYACRAGTETSFSFEGELSLEKVNYRGTWDDYEKWGFEANKSTAQFKSYAPNAWGLFEMHGNVWEWCQDRWLDRLGNETVAGSNDLVQEASRRVVRGGSWYSNGRDVRSAIRGRFSTGERDSILGLRLSLGLRAPD